VKRRAFLVCWLCLAAIGPEAGAQGAADLPRVAILSPDPPTAVDPATGNPLVLFLEALYERGYVDGRNIRLDFRFAENRLDRLPALAAELVNARPAVIYTHTTAGAFAAAGATTSIPIIVGPAGEQTMEQLAGSFAKPVANVTGFTLTVGSQSEKCLQLLKEAAPTLSRIGVLLNPDNRLSRDALIALNAAAEQLGLVLVRVESRGAVDIDRTLSDNTNRTVDGLLLDNDSTLAGDSSVRARVIEFAREQHLPSASTYSTYAQDGGLLSLGTDMGSIFRRAAEYVHRIIHGARPSELPVERPTKFQLSVNLKTAKALGLTVPPAILARANEVIE
jgi:putative tryptophan/tyrosine transport system substrate-binding protein